MKLLDHDALRTEKGIAYSTSQLWRLVKAGKFPAPIKIGARNLWPDHEIDKHITSLIQERDTGAAQ